MNMISTKTKTTPKKRLLAVEDDARLLDAITICLEQEGYEVMTARNGQEAFVRIAETIPDLIISDIMMPRGDGFSLVKNLRSNPRTDLIPIIFLTAKDGRANRLNGIRAGVDAFLTKPFEPEELVATIENILTRVSRTHQRVALAASAGSYNKPLFADEYSAPHNVNPGQFDRSRRTSRRARRAKSKQQRNRRPPENQHTHGRIARFAHSR